MDVFAFVGVTIILIKMELMKWWVWVLFSCAIGWEVIKIWGDEL